MPDQPHPLELAPEQLARHCVVDHFDFETTADLPAMREIIGQPRGVRAIEFGIDMGSPGYNVYVMGTRGTGRLTAIHRFIQARASDDPVPPDLLYVHNFTAEHQPVALQLPAGMGHQFSQDMAALIEQLQMEVTRIFAAPTFNEQAGELQQTFQAQQDELFQAVKADAAEKSFAIQSTQQGMMIVPLQDGQQMTAAAFEALDEEKRAKLEADRKQIEAALTEVIQQVAALEDQAATAVDQFVEQTAAALLNEQLVPLRATYADFPAVLAHLDAVRADALANINDFIEQDETSAAEAAPTPPPSNGSLSGLRRYEVNLLVDHHDSTGAPVVVVDLPTYQNLVGRIEHRLQYGAMTTDFTMIKPGALHQANGGFLVIRAMDILNQPFAWEALKRSLEVGEISIEEPESQGTSVITTQMLEPQPFPLTLKVIMIGSPALYYTLFENEEDFPELFKVKADFAAAMDRDSAAEGQYAAFIATRCHEEDLPHFSAAAVGRVVDYGTWLSDDQNKISTRFGEIADLIREAAYFARCAERDVTTPADVNQAINEREYRNNLYEELSHEQILEGDIIVETTGEAVGQINGLTVMQLGDHAFGQPSRITARVYVGQTNVVQIEREVKLTGPIHDKGVLILRGYLGSMYAQEIPLALGASLTFEQNYGGVEGDSASSTELYALLSALSGFPINQQLAVTGSVDQRGVIQPIGGVNHKLEGFFHICQQRGLTGQQGALIPKTNINNLMLSEPIIAAVQAGRFHIYAIEHIDQGIELLMNVPAGERQPDGTYPAGTVHHAVQERLQTLANSLRQFAAPIIRVDNA